MTLDEQEAMHREIMTRIREIGEEYHRAYMRDIEPLIKILQVMPQAPMIIKLASDVNSPEYLAAQKEIVSSLRAYMKPETEAEELKRLGTLRAGKPPSSVLR